MKLMLNEMICRAPDDGAGAAGAAGGAGADAGAAAAAAAAAAGAGAGAGAGASGEPWYASAGLDDDVKTFVSGKGFGSIGDALKAGMHADKIARERNVLDMPDPTNLAAWKGWENLGWTPDAAKYDVALPETAKDLGDLADTYKTFHDTLAKTLHEQRVPLSAAKAVAAAVLDFNLKGLREADAVMARQRSELEGALKAEWGQNFEANKELASRAMRTLGIGEAESAELDAILSSPRLVKLMHSLGTRLGEDKLVTAKGGSHGGIEAAKAEKAALEADPAMMRALRDPSHAQHQLVKQKRVQLQATIFGGG